MIHGLKYNVNCMTILCSLSWMRIYFCEICLSVSNTPSFLISVRHDNLRVFEEVCCQMIQFCWVVKLFSFIKSETEMVTIMNIRGA